MTQDASLMKSIDEAIERATTKLLSLQAANGSWNAFEDDEPMATASQMVLDAFLGRLSDRDKREGARFLASKQNEDGSFPGYPHAAAGSLAATALCLAALHAAAPEQREVTRRARAWIDGHGGLDAVVALMFSASDTTALYLAMVGLVDPRKLPDPELLFSVAPPLVHFMERKINAGVIMGAMAMGWLTRLLRSQRHTFNIDLLWLLHGLEARKCRAYLEQFQNPDGNWNGNTIQSGLYAAGMYATGARLARGPLAKAVAWLDAQKIYDEQGMHVRVFTCENWMTAFTLRALLHAGVPRTDARIDRGLRFLASAQIDVDMPLPDQRKKDAARSGGWAFQPSNPTMPDCDDTGSVLSALGLALNRDDAPLSQETTDIVQGAIDKGLPQLLDMQAPSGGWSAFVWNLGEKAPGPMYTKPNPLPRTLLEKAAFFLNPPVELKDPPVEGLTGRVLCGLGAVNYRASAPVVKDAAKFLEHQRAPNGVWWGRWLVNYLPETASVISGLAAVHYDLELPWIARAIDWLIAHQNEDGGWGETPASYADPAQAGRGPSMPPVTAIVLCALLDAGRLDSAAECVLRAVKYLLAQQQADGFWPNNGWLQVMLPPDQFYEYDGERMCRPIEALALFRKHVAAREGRPTPDARLKPLTPPGPFPVTAARATGEWPQATLAALRAFADPIADAVITAVFRDGREAVLRDVMGTLVRSDEPLPQGLPPAAVAYFTDTETLPAWADRRKLAMAERLFMDYGWAVALGLFTSSLPQAYCAAKGSRVLLQTQGITRHTRRRILETAQFVFDVLNPGAFGGEGRGVRSIQKVRLMHATIRHLILTGGDWDAPGWGVPINQEDLAGTLMTFSVVILDTFAEVGIELTDEEQDAFLHLWNVAGCLLGVDESLLPRSVADGRALMDAIRADQWQASVQGTQLAEALCASMNDYLPGGILTNLPSSLVRRIAGDRCADLLGLHKANWTTDQLTAAGDIDRFLAPFGTREGRGEKLLRYLATAMMEALISAQREGKEAGFRIPLELIRSWNLDD